MINANIFAELAVILSQMNRKQTFYQEKVDIATNIMKSLKVSEKLQRKIMDYLSNSQIYLDLQNELETFLNSISPSLKHEVMEYMFSRCMLNSFNGVGSLTQ